MTHRNVPQPQEVPQLIRSQLRCLERFRDTSARFLSAAESGDFAGLDAFENGRTSLLHGFQLFDRKLTQTIAGLERPEEIPGFITEIEGLLEEKSALIHEILAMDEKIVACITAEQCKINMEVSLSQRNSAMMKKFKSSWTPESGDQLDTRL